MEPHVGARLGSMIIVDIARQKKVKGLRCASRSGYSKRKTTEDRHLKCIRVFIKKSASKGDRRM